MVATLLDVLESTKAADQDQLDPVTLWMLIHALRNFPLATTIDSIKVQITRLSMTLNSAGHPHPDFEGYPEDCKGVRKKLLELFSF